jgi:hypothetical protein
MEKFLEAKKFFQKNSGKFSAAATENQKVSSRCRRQKEKN